jgi:hypothetical protein
MTPTPITKATTVPMNHSRPRAPRSSAARRLLSASSKYLLRRRVVSSSTCDSFSMSEARSVASATCRLMSSRRAVRASSSERKSSTSVTASCRARAACLARSGRLLARSSARRLRPSLTTSSLVCAFKAAIPTYAVPVAKSMATADAELCGCAISATANPKQVTPPTTVATSRNAPLYEIRRISRAEGRDSDELAGSVPAS